MEPSIQEELALVARCDRMLRTRIDGETLELVVAALVAALTDPNEHVAIRAAAALGRAAQNRPNLGGVLAGSLGHSTPAVQEVIEVALAELHGDDPTPFIDWMMALATTEHLVPAVRVLGRMGNPELLPLLHELAASSSASVRFAARTAIDMIPPAQKAVGQ